MKKFFVILTVILLLFSFTSCKEPEPKPKSFDSKGLWKTIATGPDGLPMEFYLDINNDDYPNTFIMIVPDEPNSVTEDPPTIKVSMSDMFPCDNKEINEAGIVTILIPDLGGFVSYRFIDNDNIEGTAMGFPFTATREKKYKVDYTTPPGSESGE